MAGALIALRALGNHRDQAALVADGAWKQADFTAGLDLPAVVGALDGKSREFGLWVTGEEFGLMLSYTKRVLLQTQGGFGFRAINGQVMSRRGHTLW